MKTCKVCGAKAYSDLCFVHKSKVIGSKRIPAKSVNEKHSHGEMYALFLSVWRKRPHMSEISGEKLFGFSSVYFHHILLKSKHPQAKFDEENIILLSTGEHGNVHIDMLRYEEVNRRRELLMKKYNL